MNSKGRQIVAFRDSEGCGRLEHPEFFVVHLPAHLRFLSLVRASVGAAVDALECDDACDDDLRLAADELAAVLIADAEASSQLELVVGYDEEDVYVRMSAVRRDREAALVVGELSRMLLDAAVESFDVRAEDACSFGVLQRRFGRPD